MTAIAVPVPWKVPGWIKWISAGGFLLLFSIITSNLAQLTVSNPSTADFFVATNGNDSNNGTSISTPWLTCAKAASTLTAGQTVQFRGGTYLTDNCRISNSGTSANRIVFENFPSEIPILSGANIPYVFANRHSVFAILNIDGNFTTVRGFEMIAAAGHNIRSHGSDNIIEDMNIHGGGLVGIFVGIATLAKRNIVRDNHVWDMYDYEFGPPPGTGGGGDADCIQVGGFGNPGDSRDHIIENNLVHDCSDDGIDTWQSVNNTITGNVVYHIGWRPFSFDVAGNGNAFKLGGGTQGGGNLVRNNAISECRTRGYDANLLGGGSALPNTLQNNTAHNCGNNYQQFTGDVYTNNLCFVGTCNNIGGITNSWNLGTGDPQFISTVGGNPNFLRLTTPTSPAINSGTNIGLPFNGAAPDLGAYETN